MKNKYLKAAKRSAAFSLSAFILTLPLLTQASEPDPNSYDMSDVNAISDTEIAENNDADGDDILIVDSDEVSNKESETSEVPEVSNVSEVSDASDVSDAVDLNNSKSLAKLNGGRTSASYRDGKVDTSTAEYAQAEFDQNQFLEEAKKLGYSEKNAQKIAEDLKNESTKLVEQYVKSRFDSLLEKYKNMYSDFIDNAEISNLSTAQQLDDYVAKKYSSWTDSRSQRVSEHIDACNTVAAVYSTNLSANYESHTININYVNSMLENIPAEQLDEVNDIIAKLKAFDKEYLMPLKEVGAIQDDFEKVDVNYNPDSSIKEKLTKAFEEQRNRKIKSLNDSLVSIAAKARSANSTISDKLSFKSKIVETLFASWPESSHPYYLNDTMRNVLPLLDAFASDLERDTPKEDSTGKESETTNKETETTETASTESETTIETSPSSSNADESITNSNSSETTVTSNTEVENSTSKTPDVSIKPNNKAKDKNKSLPKTGEKENILTCALLLVTISTLLLIKRKSLLKED